MVIKRNMCCSNHKIIGEINDLDKFEKYLKEYGMKKKVKKKKQPKDNINFKFLLRDIFLGIILLIAASPFIIFKIIVELIQWIIRCVKELMGWDEE